MTEFEFELADRITKIKSMNELYNKEGLALDRMNNDGNYEPSNCAWTTNKDNCNHNSQTHFIEYKGKIQSLSKWAEELGINYSTLRNRINRSKMSVEEAFTKGVKNV